MISFLWFFFLFFSLQSLHSRLQAPLVDPNPVPRITLLFLDRLNIKHIWLDAVESELGFSPANSTCIFCAYGGTQMVRCFICSKLAHGTVMDSAALLPEASCAHLIDNDEHMRCFGPYKEYTSERLRQGTGTARTLVDISNRHQILPTTTTDLNQLSTVEDNKLLFKSLLQNTFKAVIQREQVRLDRDIESLQLAVRQAPLNGNIHAVSTIYLGCLPESFAQIPMLRTIAKEATSSFYTTVEKEVEELKTNLNLKITEMNESFGYEVFISVIMELLSSSYLDKVIMETADLFTSVKFMDRPLNTLEYENDIEDLIGELHKWAWAQIRGQVDLPYYFKYDTHIKIKKAIDHNKHGLEMDSILDTPNIVWSTLSQDGNKKVAIPFNRRFVTIYIGICMSQTTKTNAHMQSCLKILNSEIFSRKNLDIMPDSLWRQIFSLVQPATGSYETCYTSSRSDLTKRQAKHFLSGEMVRTLLEFNHSFMKEYKVQKIQAYTQALRTLFDSNAVEVLERDKINKDQMVQELLTSATGNKEQATVTLPSLPQPTTFTTNVKTDDAKNTSSRKRSRRRPHSPESLASTGSSNISPTLPSTSANINFQTRRNDAKPASVSHDKF